MTVYRGRDKNGINIIICLTIRHQDNRQKIEPLNKG